MEKDTNREKQIIFKISYQYIILYELFSTSFYSLLLTIILIKNKIKSPNIYTNKYFLFWFYFLKIYIIVYVSFICFAILWKIFTKNKISYLVNEKGFYIIKKHKKRKSKILIKFNDILNIDIKGIFLAVLSMLEKLKFIHPKKFI